MKNGILAAAGVYILWGLLPIYWKALGAVPLPRDHESSGGVALPVVFLLLATQGQVQRLAQIARRPVAWLPFLATGSSSSSTG